jgi:hypothetical protein
MAERRYSDEEVAKILRMTGELSRGDGSEEGVSLAELQRVASELGLDPEKVRLAAERADRDAALDGGQSDFIGAPPQYEVDRLVECELTDEGWYAAVAEMESVYGDGQAKLQGTVRSWRKKTDFGWVNLTATPKNGKTLLRFGAHIDNGLGWALAAMAVLTLILGGTIFGNIAMPVWAILIGGILLVAAAAGSFKYLTKEWLKADKAKANAALEKAGEVIRSHQDLRSRLAASTPAADTEQQTADAPRLES